MTSRSTDCQLTLAGKPSTLFMQTLHLSQPNFIYLDVSVSVRDLSQKKLFSSSRGSCHGSDVTWQEIGPTCGSVYSCLRPGSWNSVPPFPSALLLICTATSIRLHTLYTVFSYLSSKGRAKGKQTIAVSTWPHRYGNSVPYRITQCYLPPSRGDIPAFTPAEADPRCTNPGGMQGCVGLVLSILFLL